MRPFSEHRVEVRDQESYGRDLGRYVNTIPALFWRIHLVQKSIEYLNDYQLPELGERSRLLLQSRDFAREVVENDDYIKIKTFIDAVYERKPAQQVIRIHTRRGTHRWVKLIGMPDQQDYSWYHGYTMDITRTVEMVLAVENEGGGIKPRLELFDTPVLLIDMMSRRLYAANRVGREFFGIRDEGTYGIKDILSGVDDIQMTKIFEHLVFYDSWEGEILYTGSSGESHRVMTSMRPLLVEGKQLIWLSFYEMTDTMRLERSSTLLDAEAVKNLSNELATAAREDSMERMLDLLLDHQNDSAPVDALLYSHICENRDVVRVWGRGEAFSSLSAGAAYPYEGTIAENIESYSLPFLVVDDTLESIKPIDWALFIPRNIRSYLAIPFYEKGILTTVLIFCAEKPRAYNESHMDIYRQHFDEFFKVLPLWKSRSSKKHLLV